MLDVNNFDSMRIGLASPEQIRKWSYGEVKNQRLSTTVHLNLNVTVCFVKKYLAQLVTGNVIAVNTNGFGIKVLFVIAVA